MTKQVNILMYLCCIDKIFLRIVNKIPSEVTFGFMFLFEIHEKYDTELHCLINSFFGIDYLKPVLR